MSNRKGVTLVEMMVVIAIMGIITSIMYTTYIYSVKSTVSHRLMSEQHTDVRAAVEFMSRELKMMGLHIGMDCKVGGTPQDDTGGDSGYGPLDPGPKLVKAAQEEIVFTFHDFSAIEAKMDDGTSNTNLTRNRLVRYWLDSTDPDNKKIKRETFRWDNENLDDDKEWVQQGTEATLLENVTAFNFDYRRKSGLVVNDVTPDLNYYDRCRVKGRVDVKVRTKGKREDPITGDERYYELTTGVTVMNMGKLTKCDEDTIAPVMEDAIALSDSDICGWINVDWAASASEDLDGYKILVTSGGDTTQYTAPPMKEGSPNTSALIGGATITNSITCLYSFPIKVGVPAMVNVTAFDDCYNQDMSGNYTITPSVNGPQVQPQFYPEDRPIAYAISNGTSITIEWTHNDDVPPKGLEPDVYYNVYRRLWTELGTEPWDITPINTNPICNAVSFTDTFSPGQGCTTFEYVVSAVNTCNGLIYNSLSVYGDGVLNGPGYIDNDQPYIDNTTTRPFDFDPPAAPDNAIAGGLYRRIILNWDNPDDLDLDHVAIRYVAGSTSPATIDAGLPVEDISGIVDDANPGAAESQEHTGVTGGGTPSLDEVSEYAYSLFAVDTCGNTSPATPTSQTTTTLCKEDILIDCQNKAPQWKNDFTCSGITESGFDVTGCGSNYEFTWNEIKDDESHVFDLTGYYVYKDPTGQLVTPSATDTKESGLRLNPVANPEWTDLPASGASADDNPLYHGNTYSYYVIPIDCERENHLGSNPWATIDGASTDPEDLPLASEVLTVSPGRITFNKPSASQLTYYDGIPNQYVTSGFLDFDGSGYPINDDPGYLHNIVIFLAYNESANPVTLNSMDLSWSNNDSYIAMLYRLDSDPPTCIWGLDADCASIIAAPVASTASLSGLDLTFDGLDSGGASCPSDDCVIPLGAVFTNSVSWFTNLQDMRNDTLDISDLTFTKTYDKGGSPITDSCTLTDPEFADVGDNIVEDNIIIPFGPEIAPDGSVFQLESAIVPTHTPTTTIGTPLPVDDDGFSARVFIANTPGETTITDAWLYYASTNTTGFASLSPPDDIYAYTPRQLVPTATPNEYVTPAGINITPLQDRAWYFLLAKDSQGNFDRHPEMENPADFTAFTYDRGGDPCDTKPARPAWAQVYPYTMEITWAPVTTNDDGSPIYDLAGYGIYQDPFGAGPWPHIGNVGPGVTSFTDPSPGPDGEKVKYVIAAFDTCATPIYGVSAGTNTVYRGFKYLFDDFTTQGWSMFSLWHPTNQCNAIAPASVYYGLNPSCTFNTGAAHSGYLASPWIFLGAAPSMSFDYSLDGQCAAGVVCTNDKLLAQVYGGGAFYDLDDLPDTGGAFVTKNYDLGVVANKWVRVLFLFDTVDAALNNFGGAYIDNIDIDP